eukprot:SM000067S20323  [mRNA]  locus=s67:382271:383044:- [translate_table: standard]
MASEQAPKASEGLEVAADTAVAPAGAPEAEVSAAETAKPAEAAPSLERTDNVEADKAGDVGETIVDKAVHDGANADGQENGAPAVVDEKAGIEKAGADKIAVEEIAVEEKAEEPATAEGAGEVVTEEAKEDDGEDGAKSGVTTRAAKRKSKGGEEAIDAKKPNVEVEA